MNLKQMREAALKAAREIAEKAKGEDRPLTDEEREQIEAKMAEVDALDEKIEQAAKDAALLDRMSHAGDADGGGHPEPSPAPVAKGDLGDAFVKSEAFRAWRKSNPSGVGNGTPVRIEVKELGGVNDVAGTKATITTETGQPTPTRVPGYRSELLDQPFTFTDLVTTGSTEASWMEYSQIVSETDNAAIVPEGELKPLSDVETDTAEAKVHTYADGFDVTNQTLADDGALAAFMRTRIAIHVRGVVESVLLNGDATANVKGILNTTGTQDQPFDTDVITTLAGALQKVEDVQVAPQAIVMNPVDAWKLSLSKDANGNYQLGNPLQQGLNPAPFGVRLVKSNRIAAGTALVGNFSGVQLLQREPLSVVAFNQHKDYAQRNMVYVRAELRAMQLIYAPREIVVTHLGAADEG